MLTDVLIVSVASVIVLQIMVFSTTIYLHRYATHRAMQMHPVAAWGFGRPKTCCYIKSTMTTRLALTSLLLLAVLRAR